MKSEKQRVEWIDVCRGLSIILIVLYHFQLKNHWSETFGDYTIYFRLPFFFFIGGFLHSFKPMGEFAIRKAKFLLLPYFSVLSLNIAFLFALVGYHLLQWELSKVLTDFGHIYTILIGDIIGGTLIAPIWFLPVYFFAQVLFNGFGRKHVHIFVLLPVLFLLDVMARSVTQDAFVFYSIDKLPRSLLFYSLGFLCAHYKLHKFFLFIPLYFPGLLILGTYEFPFALNRFVTLFIAFGGIALAVTASMLMTCVPWLKQLFVYIGKRGISILIFHELIGFVVPIDDPLPKLVTVVMTCILIFELFHLNRWSSLFFLGREIPATKGENIYNFLPANRCTAKAKGP